MARHTGKGLVVMVENSAATEVALSMVVSANTPDQHFQSVKFTGDDVESSGAGQQIGFVDVEFEYDDTATTGNHAVLAGIQGDNSNARFIRVRPAGTGTGKLEYALDGVCFGPSYTIAKDGKVMGKVRFELHHNASADPAWVTQS